MGDVIPFKRPKAGQRHRGKTLCKEGFHKWEPVSTRPFDVKQGGLVTLLRCARCGATMTKRT
jgi:hypothetical protein